MRTPFTAPPSTSSPSAGKPGKTFTPRASAFSPIHRTTSQIEAT